MCNIWKSPKAAELEPSEYAKLPPTLRTINLTGGEPFLRSDLVEVVKSIHGIAPTSRIVFSTNGLLKDTILSVVEQVLGFHRRVGVGVSIDGTEATHDKIRGVLGCYRTALSTVEGLRSIGVRDLRIGMTLTPENLGEAAGVYELSRRLGVEFTTTFAHNSEVYFQKTDNVSIEAIALKGDALSSVLRRQLRSASPKDWLRAYHVGGILDPNLRAEFMGKCEAGQLFFFMSPTGDIFPCTVMNHRIGNIRDVGSWDDLFTPDVQERIAAKARACREDCWMVCNTKTLILSHPVKAGFWVARMKTRAHLNLET